MNNALFLLLLLLLFNASLFDSLLSCVHWYTHAHALKGTRERCAGADVYLMSRTAMSLCLCILSD